MSRAAPVRPDCGMSTEGRRIALACTTCDLVVSTPAGDEEQARGALGAFFVAHADHATWIDVSAAGGTLPRPRSAGHLRVER